MEAKDDTETMEDMEAALKAAMVDTATMEAMEAALNMADGRSLYNRRRAGKHGLGKRELEQVRSCRSLKEKLIRRWKHMKLHKVLRFYRQCLVDLPAAVQVALQSVFLAFISPHLRQTTRNPSCET